jgi:deoxyadenosine/deoxycytidine kinase
MASGNEMLSVPIHWITIEGNIGSGKSTFVSYLKSLPWDINVEFVPEPVDIWETIRDSATGKSMLELFYGDQERNAFSFQMMAYISRLTTIRESIRKVLSRHPTPTPEKPVVIISERCLETDANVFAKMLHNDGKIRGVDYQIYRKWFDEFIRDLPKPKIIYVRTNPEICSKRIIRRLRKGEEGIPLDYLLKCHEYHEEWIRGTEEFYTPVDSNGNVKRERKSSAPIVLNGNAERDITDIEPYDDWMEILNECVF